MNNNAHLTPAFSFTREEILILALATGNTMNMMQKRGVRNDEEAAILEQAPLIEPLFHKLNRIIEAM